MTIIEQQNGVGAAQAEQVQHVLERLGHQFSNHARTEAVFGESRTIGAQTLIPVAQVRYAFAGGGSDAAPVPGAPRGVLSTTTTGGGSGTIGGLGVRPVAVIVVTSDGVTVRPIPDVQSMVGWAFGFATFALMAGLLFGRRPRRPGFAMRIGNIGRVGSPQIKVGPPRFACNAFGARRRLFR